MDATTPMSTQQRKSMDTGTLKKFAQEARRVLRDQVSAKLAQVLADNSAARREAPKAVQQLAGEIGGTSRDQVIERVAYTWFNRFTALRFMDANGYTTARVVTPADGQTRPEILSEAMAGGISGEVPEAVATQVRALLDNRTPSRDPQGEAYRLLLVAACNHWHAAMPFMFETIADYTELLMPEDLLSQSSILARLRTVMTEEACQDVEIIGWLYQFYISEKKDEVFAGLKKNKKITPENIPAATQLFTPHWIVRYLVENSIGRLWMLNRPNSRLKERMDYYIAPEEPETEFLRISSPEEIKVCDPACGSGHMLTYAFDLLYAIYEEEGYDAAEIPSLILTRNLYGIELDERAGALAAFALTMKAAARRKRFLRHGVQPNVCVLEPIRFEPGELNEYMDAIGRDLFTAPLRQTLTQFEEANNFGSLIRPALTEVADLQQIVESKHGEGNLFLRSVHERVQTVLRMADFLAPKYHVVVANPPYMGGKGMNEILGDWLKAQYPDSKTDLMTCFMERAASLCRPCGMWGMINLPSWLFLGSFENCRKWLLDHQALKSLLQLGRGIFGSDFGSVAFTICNREPKSSETAIYRRLFDKHVDVRPVHEIERLFLDPHFGRHSFQQFNFKKIPSSPIAYWISSSTLAAFEKYPSLNKLASPRQGMATTNNDRFLRQWFEVTNARSAFGLSPDEGRVSRAKWFPLNKGGEFRRWYGNNYFVVNYENNGREMCDYIDNTPGVRVKSNGRVINRDLYFHEGLTWSTVTSGAFSLRYSPQGSIFETKGAMLFPREIQNTFALLGLFNTKIVSYLLGAISPTLDFHEGPMGRVPVRYDDTSINPTTNELGRKAVNISKLDWDGYEISWGFAALPLLAAEHRGSSLAETYTSLRARWRGMTEEMQRLEEENNRIFINAYGLQDELTAEVPLEEITLTCNPAYRYGGKRSEAELEPLLLADTTREFVSYAVGCMFGRYSVDAPGTILANQGEGLEDYLTKVPNPTFEPDRDGVIPVLDGDWFVDDIAARFRKFLRVTFGDQHFQENLAFIEEALGKDIRKYFTRDFFGDHVKRYKRRPIYWLFSSPRGTFNALIYMHRYRPDTVSVVLNEYLREFRSKLEAHRRAQEALSISGEASGGQKTKALKEIEATAKQIEELDAWERDVLFPLATQKIEIDLDDGVKANYPKFGAALKPIKGLNDTDD
ncbi:BREX-1 system adenine-specific DNA-methyltransferase PglX [Ciceribacter sp. T2.26MG-112.2]|uniref:BREX-1 system adenine-specific DNA-methyltransferase PglX n=1 Tax=Ciceribacter sp. T2.26MG-112.2 TaxID=3137154 RepID=UPI001E2E0D13|nr:BREX-1 system adenine-specific DNA-methyltransferase PglX [Ciceribacter naphthalenivorans]